MTREKKGETTALTWSSKLTFSSYGTSLNVYPLKVLFAEQAALPYHQFLTKFT